MPIRVKTRLARRKKLLYEVGVGITLLVVLLGVLSTITMNASIVLLTTEDVYNRPTKIVFFYINSTSGARSSLTYNLSDVATFYNGYIYISIPAPPAGYNKFQDFALILVHDDGSKYTYKELESRGFSKLEVYLEYINTTPLTTYNNIIEFWPGPIVIGTVPPKYNTSIIVNATLTIDLGKFTLDTVSKGVQSSEINLLEFHFDVNTDPSNIDAIKLKLALYGISKKPVLAIYAEPVYAALTAVVSALYAAARRIQQYALSAFGGLSLATLFSGLTGSAVAAMILGILFFIVMVELRKKR